MHTQPAVSIYGLLMSLSSELPANDTLARRARAIAPRLAVRHNRALDDRAAALLTALLDATDCEDLAGYPTDGCLDSEWDA